MPLLLPLVDLTAFLIALGLCIIAIFLVRALFGAAGSAVGWIPWVGSKIKGDLHVIEQKLTSELGQVVAGLDHAMAQTWYKLAHLAERIGHEIMANAGLLAAIAATIAGLPGFADWRAFIAKVKASLVWAEQHALGAVHTLTRPLTANVSALSRWTHAQIRALHNTIAVTIPGEFAGLRKRAKALEDARLRHFDWLKRIDARFGVKAFAAAIVGALAYLGLSWIRCGKLKTRGPALCNLDDNLFAALLADSLLIVGSLSLVQLGKEMQPIVGESARLIQDFWRVT